MRQPCQTALAMLLGLMLWTASLSVQGSDTRPFERGSLNAILAAHRGTPFVLHLWSLECRPCLADLATLSHVRREHPRLEVVLVSTDDIGRADELGAVLKARGLDDTESWAFAGRDAERLRYEIDPQWFGELPRSYFYDATQHRIGISGALKPEQLTTWLEDLR